MYIWKKYCFLAPQNPEISDYERGRGKPLPSFLHSVAQTNLSILLQTHLAAHLEVLPEITLELPDGRITPDLAIFEAAGLATLDGDAPAVALMPLTVVEILTTPQTIDVQLNQADKYFANGVQSYWMVVPMLQATLVFSAPREYRFFNKNETLTDPKTGIELRVGEFFE